MSCCIPLAVCLKVPGWPAVGAKLAAGMEWRSAHGATVGFASRAPGASENLSLRASDALRRRTARTAYPRKGTVAFAPGSLLEIGECEIRAMYPAEMPPPYE